MPNHVIIRLIRFVSWFTVYLYNAIYFLTTFSTPCKWFTKILYFAFWDLNKTYVSGTALTVLWQCHTETAYNAELVFVNFYISAQIPAQQTLCRCTELSLSLCMCGCSNRWCNTPVINLNLKVETRTGRLMFKWCPLRLWFYHRLLIKLLCDLTHKVLPTVLYIFLIKAFTQFHSKPFYGTYTWSRVIHLLWKYSLRVKL